MSDDPITTPLSPCGCCEDGVHVPPISNPPGQPQLRYRIGTHGSFLARMLSRIAGQRYELEGEPDRYPLEKLTTRQPDDPAIALLDGWATVADVLSFYQERIANEGFLRTATERQSVLQLARAIGYELNPGVAAGTHLAFDVEDAKTAPGVASVPAGTRALSIPSGGGPPQTFETSDEVVVRAEWNAMRPQKWLPQDVDKGWTELYLEGVSTRLQPGDGLLLVGNTRLTFKGSERWDFRILQTVTEYPERGYTHVTWHEGLGHDNPTVFPADNPRAYAFRLRANLFGYNAPDWRTMPRTVQDEFDDARHNPLHWPDFENPSDHFNLDAAYPKVVAGSWVVLKQRTYTELYGVVEADVDSVANFGLAGKVTRIIPDSFENLRVFDLRDTTAYAESEELAVSRLPQYEPVQGDLLALDGVYEGLAPGRLAAVSGKRLRVEVTGTGTLNLVSSNGLQTVAITPGSSLIALGPPSIAAGGGLATWRLRDATGFEGAATASPSRFAYRPALEDDEEVHEIVTIEDVVTNLEFTTIEIEHPLAYIYDRDTVRINANVVAATHGETTREEVLGSGDASRKHQSFTLAKVPLTYVSASTRSGSQSTLTLRVEGVEWQETPSFYPSGPRDESYVVRISDDGKASVTTGDGKRGARLPTGQENVVATYRTGIGPDGEVDAGSLSLMPSRPSGVRGVSNPLKASGAAAPETLANARENAPLTTLTLDRVVSERDFEDFSRAFAGIAKAQAIKVWNGQNRIVFITVAGNNGNAVLPSSSLYKNLVDALRTWSDPVQQVSVTSYEELRFKVDAGLLIDPRFVAEDVMKAVKATLSEAFSFQRRQLGQPVTTAELVMDFQAVDGVKAVDINRLHLTTDPAGPSQTLPPAVLAAARARLEEGNLLPAQLLLLADDGVTLSEMTS